MLTCIDASYVSLKVNIIQGRRKVVFECYGQVQQLLWYIGKVDGPKNMCTVHTELNMWSMEQLGRSGGMPPQEIFEK